MKIKTIGQLLIALLFFSGILRIVSAPSTSFSLVGGGVTVNLAFPEEAHPNITITHNITITSSTIVTLRNFTVVIKALVNSNWQEIFSGTNEYGIPPQLPQNYTLTLALPQDANDRLQCFIFVNTSSIDDLSATVYTTLVSKPTFSEMLADYTALQANYTSLMNEYNGLLANYSTLLANYTALLSEHNELLAEYSAQVASYQSLDSKYRALQSEVSSLSSSLNTKSSDYNSLQTSFGSLNSTFSSLEGNYTELQGNYTVLEGFYNSLNDVRTQLEDDYSDLQSSSDVNRVVMFILVMIVAGLIALIIYIRRRESEPYVIIRKETVALKPDKKS
jgi:hypothetical protein